MKEGNYIKMREITQGDYLEFIKNHKKVIIENTEIILGEKQIDELQPKDFELESETVWSFKDRGIGQLIRATIEVIGHPISLGMLF